MSANKYKQTICFNELFLSKMTDPFTHHILLNQYTHAIMQRIHTMSIWKKNKRYNLRIISRIKQDSYTCYNKRSNIAKVYIVIYILYLRKSQICSFVFAFAWSKTDLTDYYKSVMRKERKCLVKTVARDVYRVHKYARLLEGTDSSYWNNYRLYEFQGILIYNNSSTICARARAIIIFLVLIDIE